MVVRGREGQAKRRGGGVGESWPCELVDEEGGVVWGG